MAEKSTKNPVRTESPHEPGDNFQPFISPHAQMPEFTWLPVITGTLLGIVFGASSLYLVLKVGLTVSASIPVAVISITLFRLLAKMGFRPATILENNIVQTAGSAGESIAFGLGVTMPAILILGFDLEIVRVMLVAVLGGLLGILMMIPLRRALIVKQHGTLKYPEGTACAEVLKAGALVDDDTKTNPAEVAQSASGAQTIFAGFGIGLIYKTLMAAFKLWKDTPERIFKTTLPGGSISAEIAPELLGVGYIIGPYLGAIMCGGGVLAYLVLIPAIKFFGEGLPGPLAPGTIPIRDMSPNDIREAYVLYIGAGAVAAGGIISLFRSLPIIWHGIQEGLGMLGKGVGGSRGSRTDQDLSLKVVVIGIIALVIAITLAPPLHTNAHPLAYVAGAILIIIFGFLFATVSSRLTGEIGSSSNPISGMTVATLLLTCLIFLLLGWTEARYYVTALSVGGIVCIAASNAGTTSQDLKTGFLIGATPRLQQLAILIGAFASALVLGPILLQLNDGYTVYVPAGQAFPAELRAPKSELVKQEHLKGPQAKSDPNAYWVWQKTNSAVAPPGRYLVDQEGYAKYLVDPGINGTHKTRPDGSAVDKFQAPKATLMSYIIKGILSQQLPWGLVLLGVMIAIVLEMASIPSLAFAVGVYLQLSSSTPIFIGGMIRWLVDRYLARKHRNANLTPEQLAAEGDKSPGVLMASGYIAGGAIAGIAIAFMVGVMTDSTQRINSWAEKFNPFYNGKYADLLSLIPFLVLMAILYLTGREVLLRDKRSRPTKS